MFQISTWTNFIFVFSGLCQDPEVAMTIYRKGPESDTSP